MRHKISINNLIFVKIYISIQYKKIDRISIIDMSKLIGELVYYFFIFMALAACHNKIIYG